MIRLLNSKTHSICDYLHRLSPAAFLRGWRRGQFRSLLDSCHYSTELPPQKRSPFLPLNFWSPSNLLWPKDNAKHDVHKSLQTSSMCAAISCCIQSTKWKRPSSATGKGDSRSPQTPVVTADQPSVIHQIGGQDSKLPSDWCLHKEVQREQEPPQLGPVPFAKPMVS